MVSSARVRHVATHLKCDALARTSRVAIALGCLPMLTVSLVGLPQTGARRLWDVQLETAQKAQQKKKAQNSTPEAAAEPKPTYRVENAKTGPKLVH